jgi:hypothetical protein
MPFGGHQQICRSKMLSSLPYFHLLPSSVYKNVLKTFSEKDACVQELLEIKETGISTERFETLMKNNDFEILKRQLYFISPIYSYKFHLKPMKQLNLISAIPFVRDFFTTAAYYIVEKKN